MLTKRVIYQTVIKTLVNNLSFQLEEGMWKGHFGFWAYSYVTQVNMEMEMELPQGRIQMQKVNQEVKWVFFFKYNTIMIYIFLHRTLFNQMSFLNVGEKECREELKGTWQNRNLSNYEKS